MDYFNICTKKQYESNGQTKTKWLNCGTLRKNNDGKMFIELNHMLDVTLFVFEQKQEDNRL